MYRFLRNKTVSQDNQYIRPPFFCLISHLLFKLQKEIRNMLNNI